MTLRPILEQAVVEKIAAEGLKRVPNDPPLDYFKRQLIWERSWRRKSVRPRPRGASQGRLGHIYR